MARSKISFWRAYSDFWAVYFSHICFSYFSWFNWISLFHPLRCYARFSEWFSRSDWHFLTVWGNSLWISVINIQIMYIKIFHEFIDYFEEGRLKLSQIFILIFDLLSLYLTHLCSYEQVYCIFIAAAIFFQTWQTGLDGLCLYSNSYRTRKKYFAQYQCPFRVFSLWTGKL